MINSKAFSSLYNAMGPINDNFGRIETYKKHKTILAVPLCVVEQFFFLTNTSGGKMILCMARAYTLRLRAIRPWRMSAAAGRVANNSLTTKPAKYKYTTNSIASDVLLFIVMPQSRASLQTLNHNASQFDSNESIKLAA